MDDNPPSLFIDVHNPKDGVTWWANGIYLGQGENPVELPEEVHPGKINVKLMTYCWIGKFRIPKRPRTSACFRAKCTANTKKINKHKNCSWVAEKRKILNVERFRRAQNLQAWEIIVSNSKGRISWSPLWKTITNLTRNTPCHGFRRHLDE